MSYKESSISSQNTTSSSFSLTPVTSYRNKITRLTINGDQDCTIPTATWTVDDFFSISKVGTGRKRLIPASGVTFNAIKNNTTISDPEYVFITGKVDVKVQSSTVFDLYGDYDIAINPEDHANNVSFFNAQNLASLTKNGGGTPANNDPVTTWGDSNSNGYDHSQGTLANMPLYQTSGINGYPAILGDGVDDYFSRAYTAALNTSSQHIFAVTQLNSTASANSFIFSTRLSNPPNSKGVDFYWSNLANLIFQIWETGSALEGSVTPGAAGLSPKVCSGSIKDLIVEADNAIIENNNITFDRKSERASGFQVNNSTPSYLMSLLGTSLYLKGLLGNLGVFNDKLEGVEHLKVFNYNKNIYDIK